jgi:hypothetical protein
VFNQCFCSIVSFFVGRVFRPAAGEPEGSPYIFKTMGLINVFVFASFFVGRVFRPAAGGPEGPPYIFKTAYWWT